MFRTECVEEGGNENEDSLLASLDQWLQEMQSIALSQDSYDSLEQEDVACIVESIQRTSRKASSFKALQTVCKATSTLLDHSEIMHYKENIQDILEVLNVKRSQHPQAEDLIDTLRTKIQESGFDHVSSSQGKIEVIDFSLGSSFDQVTQPTKLTSGSDCTTVDPAPCGGLAENVTGGDSTSFYEVAGSTLGSDFTAIDPAFGGEQGQHAVGGERTSPTQLSLGSDFSASPFAVAPVTTSEEWGEDGDDDLTALLLADETSLTKVLHEVYGKGAFRSGQLEALQAMLYEGRDVVGVFPPGYGKTLVLQFPSVYSQKVAFIVTPLIILRDTQAEEAEKRNLTCIKLGGNDKKDVEDGLSRLRNSDGKAVLVFMTPEFAVKHAEALKDALPRGLRSLSHIGIDEAHLTYEWQSFRPEYGSLGKMRSVFPGVPMMAMSATVTSEGLDRMKSILRLENCVVLQMPLKVPNVKLIVARKSGTTWGDILFACNGHPGSEPTLVYCRSKEECGVLVKEFCAAGIAAVQYHGGMFDEERMAAHLQFFENKCPVMVATTAYGLGVDKPDVGRVIHYGLPSTLESYVQQIGRAGRGGQEASSCLLWSEAEMQLAKKKAFQPAEKTNLKYTEEYVRSKSCRRKALMNRFGGHVEEERGEGTCCDNCVTGRIWHIFLASMYDEGQ